MAALILITFAFVAQRKGLASVSATKNTIIHKQIKKSIRTDTEYYYFPVWISKMKIGKRR